MKTLPLIFSIVLTSLSLSVQAEQVGQINWFNAQAGFGYIVPAGGGEKVFMHFSALQGDKKTVAVGETVYYDTDSSKKTAIRVSHQPSEKVSQR